MTRILVIARITWLEVLRRKDLYVLLVLLGALLMTLVSLNIFGLGGLDMYVKDVGLLIVWIFGWVLSVGVTSRALPQEEQRGTIFPLLAKPITRLELIAGKWLGSWTVVSAAVAVFYVLVTAVIALRGGRMAPVPLLQGYVLHCLALGILCALALLFSTRMNHDATAALTYVLTVAAMLVIPFVPAFMLHAGGLAGSLFMVMYNLLPHFELFDMRKRMVYDYGPLDWKTFFLVTTYGIIYTASLLLWAWMAYRRKRFSRGNLV